MTFKISKIEIHEPYKIHPLVIKYCFLPLLYYLKKKDQTLLTYGPGTYCVT
jgi:hypothetical protein